MSELTFGDVDDVTVMAYADGELDPLRTAQMDAITRTDDALRRRIESFAASRRMLTSCFDEVLDQPIPEALLRTLAMPTMSAAAAPRHDAGGWRRRSSRNWKAPLRIAMAASLVAAVIAGLNVQRDQSPTLLAQISPALEQAASGTPMELTTAAGTIEVLPLASFRTDDGQYCRDFEALHVGATNAERGRACRNEQGQWDAVAMARSSGAAGSYVAASGSADDAPGMRRLDDAEEAAALSSAWARD